MTIRVIELFSGIGAQAEALKELGLDYEVVATSDISKKANIGYEAIHGQVNNLGDITKIEHLPECDLLTYSFPCLKAGTPILTENGWMNIEDIPIGIKVETDRGLRTVVDSSITGIQSVRTIVPSCGLPITCTDYHPFLVRKRNHIWNNKRRSYDRVFTEPHYVKASNLTKEYYVGYPIPSENREVPHWEGIDMVGPWGHSKHSNIISEYLYDEDFWWMIGRYIADGWQRTQGGIVLGIGPSKYDHIQHIPFKYTVCRERTTYKVHITYQEIGVFCKQFGSSALTKHIPKKYLTLPKHLAIAMLEGYLAGDGYCTKDGFYKASTVSRSLALDLVQLISYCYNTPVYMGYSDKRKTCTIEGRICNMKPIYTVSFKKDKRVQDNAFCEDGWIWSPIKHISEGNSTMIPVYDITVEDRHCFNCAGIITKNCTSISTAGKREGLTEGSNTESSLVWEVGRLLKDMRERECLPEVLLMENVDALLSKKFKPTFDKWCNLLSEMGYCNSYQIMNAKDYGTPQSRKRVFMVSTLTLGEFIFPEPCPDGRVLKDILEEDVDESYFLDKRVQSFRFNPKMTDTDRLDVGELNIEGWHRTARAVVGENGQAPTVCRSANNLRTKVITEIVKVGEIEDEKFDQDKRVYSKNGLSPTLRVGGESAQGNIEIIGRLSDTNFSCESEVYSTKNISHHYCRGSGSHRKILLAGEITDTKFNKARMVMDEKDISRTITAEHTGICFPKILVRK